MAKERTVEAGRITNTHGVRGEVKIEVWLDSPDFLRRCKGILLEGKKVRFTSAKVQERFLIAGLEGIGTVEEAARLKGKTVFIDREDAPLKKGEYFLQDIIGADVVDETGEKRLVKEKTSVKHVPPDLSALKAYMELRDTELTRMSDEELEKEKERLLQESKEKEKKE